jgi:hypothetical protein
LCGDRFMKRKILRRIRTIQAAGQYRRCAARQARGVALRIDPAGKARDHRQARLRPIGGELGGEFEPSGGGLARAPQQLSAAAKGLIRRAPQSSPGLN